jgi:hypothetical protein
MDRRGKEAMAQMAPKPKAKAKAKPRKTAKKSRGK